MVGCNFSRTMITTTMTMKIKSSNTVPTLLELPYHNLSILIHACLGTSIGMFVRLLKHNIDTETGTARPLISDKLQKTLGRVVCERATPFPSRTFDTTTLHPQQIRKPPSQQWNIIYDPATDEILTWTNNRIQIYRRRGRRQFDLLEKETGTLHSPALHYPFMDTGRTATLLCEHF